jgi:hypothetical protein
MARSTQSEEAFIYSIPAPSISRGIALAFAAFFVFCFLIVPFKSGIDRTLTSIHTDPGLWLVLIAMFVPPIAFFLALAFSPRSWCARIELRRDGIRSIPKPPLRWIGEPSVTVPIDPQANEILICRGSKEIYGGFSANVPRPFPYGFRLFVRSTQGHDRELTIETGDRLTANQAGILAAGITASTGLPVRLVKREAGSEGVMRETPWVPDKHAAGLGCFLKLAFAATPFIGGIVVGYLTSEPLIVCAVGIALWLAQTVAIFAYAHISHQKQSGIVKLYWFTTLFTFAASYLVAFVAVHYVFSSH